MLEGARIPTSRYVGVLTDHLSHFCSAFVDPTFVFSSPLPVSSSPSACTCLSLVLIPAQRDKCLTPYKPIYYIPRLYSPPHKPPLRDPSFRRVCCLFDYALPILNCSIPGPLPRFLIPRMVIFFLTRIFDYPTSSLLYRDQPLSSLVFQLVRPLTCSLFGPVVVFIPVSHPLQPPLLFVTTILKTIFFRRHETDIHSPPPTKTELDSFIASFMLLLPWYTDPVQNIGTPASNRDLPLCFALAFVICSSLFDWIYSVTFAFFGPNLCPSFFPFRPHSLSLNPLPLPLPLAEHPPGSFLRRLEAPFFRLFYLVCR